MSTNTEELTIEHLDYSFAPPCEALSWIRQWRGVPRLVGGCDNVAEWAVLMSGCCEKGSGTRFYCDECLQKKLRMDRNFCPYCGTYFKPPSEAYLSMTRI